MIQTDTDCSVLIQKTRRVFNKRWTAKSECHYPYKLRGNDGDKESRRAITRKTEFGLFLIKILKHRR